MRRLVQLLSLLTLATSGVMLAGSFTGAQASATVKSQPTVLQAAWFWQNLYAQVNPPVGQAPPSQSEPSGVPDGDLPVAHTSADAGSSKQSVVAFDLAGAAAPGTIIDSFTVTLTVDSGNPQAANAGTPSVVACLPTRLWAAEQGGSIGDAPPVDCSMAAKPKVNGNTYTFDVTSMAQDWVNDQNLGIALVNDPANTQTPYQVDFTGAKTIKASMLYTPPVQTSTTGSTTTGSTTTSGGTTPTTGGTAPVLTDPNAGVPSLPSAGTTASDAGPAPQVAAPAPAPRATTVAHIAAAPTAPTRGFWVVAAVFALLLLLCSLVLGDDVTSQTGSTSRLDRVLRGRTGSSAVLASRS